MPVTGEEKELFTQDIFQEGQLRLLDNFVIILHVGQGKTVSSVIPHARRHDDTFTHKTVL